MFARTIFHQHVINNSPHLIHTLVDPAPQHEKIVKLAKLTKAANEAEAILDDARRRLNDVSAKLRTANATLQTVVAVPATIADEFVNKYSNIKAEEVRVKAAAAAAATGQIAEVIAKAAKLEAVATAIRAEAATDTDVTRKRDKETEATNIMWKVLVAEIEATVVEVDATEVTSAATKALSEARTQIELALNTSNKDDIFHANTDHSESLSNLPWLATLSTIAIGVVTLGIGYIIYRNSMNQPVSQGIGALSKAKQPSNPLSANDITNKVPNPLSKQWSDKLNTLKTFQGDLISNLNTLHDAQKDTKQALVNHLGNAIHAFDEIKFDDGGQEPMGHISANDGGN